MIYKTQNLTPFSGVVRHNNDKRMEINLNNKMFKSLSNSENGEVSDSTIFHYHQEKQIIWAEYIGGEIQKGFLIGKIDNLIIEFTYQHLNRDYEIMTGKCKSKIELSNINKIQLFEDWEWTCKDFSKGKSTLIEV